MSQRHHRSYRKSEEFKVETINVQNVSFVAHFSNEFGEGRICCLSDLNRDTKTFCKNKANTAKFELKKSLIYVNMTFLLKS